MDQRSPQAGQGTGNGERPAAERTRRFGATRVRPRIEFGQPKSEQAVTGSPLTPEVMEPGMEGGLGGGAGAPFGGGADPFGGGADPFGPRSFAGGRVRVYGCSPGCLIASLVVSLILTLLLNGIF